MPSTFHATVTSELSQQLLLESITYSASLSKLEETQLVVRCTDHSLDLGRLAQTLLVVDFATPQSTHRYVSGQVIECEAGGHSGALFTYSIVLRPWLWLLTLRTDFCIYQNKTVRQIVEAVFAKYDGVTFDFRLTDVSYKNIEYCTQMFESDFDFIARLLALEGIYWYFEHSASGHKLVLVDSLSAHAAASGYENVRFYEQGASKASTLECVTECLFGQRVRPQTTSFSSYDFLNPSASLRSSTNASSYDVFDYYGKSLITQTAPADNTSRLQDLSRVRLQELRSDAEVMRGEGTVVGLEVGRLFTLTDHWRTDGNSKYLLTSIEIDARAHFGDSTADSKNASHFLCRFSGMPANVQYRPARLPKPSAKGPMSAVIVGTSGEEIVTNQYGQVKLQFHFDRYGRKNNDSSCWVRVSQATAGTNFGTIQIPRIGQEVIVAFLDGDPDQPIVVGSVYNAQSMPPWTLPDNATQSGMLSRSSKGGSYAKANALRFEDKAGAEEVLLHAENLLTLEVEKNETHTVGGDRTLSIEGNETLTVKKNRDDTVTQDATTTIQGKRTVKISKDDSLDAQTIELKASNSLSLTCGSASIKMSSDGTISIKGVNVKVEGTAVKVEGTTVTVQGSGQFTVKGGLGEVNASGILTLKGAMTKVN